MTPAEAVEVYGTIAAAARAMGVPRETFRDKLKKTTKPEAPSPKLSFAELPDKNEPLEDLLGRCTDHYKRLRAHTDAAAWQTVKVNGSLPIGVALMGDPHLDDPGCNWPKLKADVDTIVSTEGCYAINVGDYTNNWVGRLTRLFGNQELSQASARRLTEWLLLKSGISWLAVVLGNHDEWNEGGEIIRLMCANRVGIKVHEWQAKLELVFDNGEKCRINTAHDFKGRSIYSAIHGIKREAIWYQDGAHINVAGHIHFGEIGQCELPGGHNPWMVRVRGYKEMDSHALVNGYHEGRHFSSVMAIIDPEAPEENRVMIFGSLQQGAAVLAAMRQSRLKSLPKASARKPRQSSKARPKSKKSGTQAQKPSRRSPKHQGASPSRARSRKRAA